MAGIILTLATVLCEISSQGQTLLGNDSKILENDAFATHDFHNVGKENVKPVSLFSCIPAQGAKREKQFLLTSGFNETGKEKARNGKGSLVGRQLWSQGGTGETAHKNISAEI